MIASKQLKSAERQLRKMKLTLSQRMENSQAPTVDVQVGEDSPASPDCDQDRRVSLILAAEERKLHLLKRELDELMKRVESSQAGCENSAESENESNKDTVT